MSNEKYWVLGELNINKKDEDDFELFGGNGSLLELDREASITALTLNGVADITRWENDLKEHGIKTDSRELEKFLQLLERNGLVSTKDFLLEKMDYNRVIQNIDKYERGMVGISNATVSVTYACPYDCVYCLRLPIKVGRRVDSNYVETAIEEIAELGGRLLTFTGGEPELEPELLKRYTKAAKNSGIESISLATRGYQITKELLIELRGLGLTDIVVSLDSPNEIQDEISRFKGAFKLAINAIELANRTEGIRTSINFTCYGQNTSLIKPTAELAKKYGIRMKVTPYIERGGLEPLSVKETKDIESILQNLELGYLPVSCLSAREEAMPYDTPMICEAGITRAHIEVDGNVSGCQFIAYRPQAVAGSVKDGFTNVWHNGDWSLYRESEPINKECGTCEERKYCVRNCLALADALYADPKMINIPNCKLK